MVVSGSGVQFTETMRGFASTSAIDDYAEGFERGKADDSPEFTVTVTADDVDRLVGEREHEARLEGTVTAPALSPTPLTVENGLVHLCRDAEHAASRQMLYAMPLVADDGRRFFLEGFEQIHDDKGLDLWKDTTTLYVTVHHDHRDGPVAAKGIATIHVADFAKQMTTMRVGWGRWRSSADVRRVAQRDVRRRVRPAEQVQPRRPRRGSTGPCAPRHPKCTSSRPRTASNSG